jgi:hypothetical protein
MKLIEINNNGTATFSLNDGRKLKSYKSGYVRINSNRLDRLYQINKVVKEIDPYWTGRTGVVMYNYKRVLIPNELDRLEYIINWVKRNVK